MADRMPSELIARDILDSSRDYRPAVWSGFAGDFGKLLYERLIANFLFGDEVSNTQSLSFAQIVRKNTKENTVTLRKNGFTIVNITMAKSKKVIQKIERRIEVDMVAITDWNGDGFNDWLVAAKLLRTRVAVPRVYYIVISNPPAAGMLNANVLGVYEDMGVVGRLYMRDTKVKNSAPVEDVVPGLKPVTTPPESKKTKSSTIKERVLD